jgi:hypothetical protein
LTAASQRGSRVAPLCASMIAVFVMAGCAASSSNKQPVSVPAAPSAGDASYDWHVLVLVPFGMLFKESPIPLHEVLLFHDESPGSPNADSKDCYTVDRPPPRFVGTQPDPYLLCFDHDRLSRIEAAVRLAGPEAREVLSKACALWLKGAAPAQGDGNSCDGTEGRTAFSAHLAFAPGNAAATLSLTLVNASRDDSHAP